MKTNFTQKLAHSAARKPRTVIGIWAVVFIVSMVLVTTMLGDAITTETTHSINTESIQASDLLAERINLNTEDEVDEMVIIRSSSYVVDDAAYQKYVEGIYNNIMALGSDKVLEGSNYYASGDEALVSEDRHATIIQLILAANDEHIIAPIHDIVDETNTAANFEVLVTGDATMQSDSMKLADDVMQTGESIGIMVALVILALVFGAIASAIVPIFLAIIAVVVSWESLRLSARDWTSFSSFRI